MPNLAQLIPSMPQAYHRAEIASSLRGVCAASERYWNAMSAEEFARPLGGAWAPAVTVRHLTKTVRAVALGLRLPRLLLLVMFGWPRRAPRSLDGIVADYHEALKGGGQAGAFAPRRTDVPLDLIAYRHRIVSAHRAAVSGLALQTLGWSRRQIDTIRLPHPLLGKLSVREMLLFTLYHNLHHVRVVARRRGEWLSDTTPLAGD